MHLAILSLGVVSFLISWCCTYLMIRIAPQFGLVDRPGGRKIHAAAKPMGGGVAIVVAFLVPLILAVAVARIAPLARFAQLTIENCQLSIDNLRFDYDALRGGVRAQTSMALVLIASIIGIHVVGLFDDLKPLGPVPKLIAQFIVAAIIVIPFNRMRILTALDAQIGAHGILSVSLAILWIVAITNAFNFLDNMDGLSAGVAAVCATAFLVTALSIESWFVGGCLALLLGAVLGFLVWNFPPARIFMGDSGSLVIGLILGVLTVRTTYLPPGKNWGAGWYSVFAPLIVLALPLYDLVVVSIIRITRGKSPFVGDTNHFSHRLVARGMSRRTAVLCLYLITAATSIAAVILPHVQNGFLALLIVAQTLLVLGVVALLEQHPLPIAPTDDA